MLNCCMRFDLKLSDTGRKFPDSFEGDDVGPLVVIEHRQSVLQEQARGAAADGVARLVGAYESKSGGFFM